MATPRHISHSLRLSPVPQVIQPLPDPPLYYYYYYYYYYYCVSRMTYSLTLIWMTKSLTADNNPLTADNTIP
jgi:hypothetical protein